ncbi:MAG: hypothetical protein ACRER6_14865, partial [Pseudomonas sp.]
MKTNELISKTHGFRRFWNKRMSLSEMQLTRKGRGRSLTDEDCHTYLLASISFIQGDLPMKFAPKLLATALCLGLAGQVFATDLK